MTACWRYIPNASAFAALWWLLSGGAPNSWIVGVPTVSVTTWAAVRLQANSRWNFSLIGLLRLLPLFISESLRGGVDVATRTLAPKMRIAPGFITFDTQLRKHQAQVFFANCICLLPGTLAADWQDERLTVHLLDNKQDPTPQLRRLERAVGLIYREYEI